MDRRQFIATTTLALGAPLGRRVPSAGAGTIRLGAPVLADARDPDDLAQAHRRLGYRAAYCPDVPLSDTERVRAVREAFARRDVVIAEVGRWCNLLDADPEKRRKNLDDVTEGLALAEAIGARCCVDIAGSFNPTSLVRPASRQPVGPLLRRRRRERAEDHRRGEAPRADSATR